MGIEHTPMQADLIEELRLRRWARENYVQAEYRDESWHPIILDEMFCRDSELKECEKNTTTDDFRYRQSEDPARRHRRTALSCDKRQLIGQTAAADQNVADERMAAVVDRA